MKNLAILGASGHGKVVANTAELCGWNSISFFDDAWSGESLNALWPVCGDTKALLEQINKFDGVVVAIGNNKIRAKKIALLSEAGAAITTLVHPSACVSTYAEIGVGSVIFAGVVVNASTCIGIGAILNTNSSIDHDCVLGQFVHISPGACLAGGVIVGDFSWIGVGASIKQQINVGRNVLVGVGAAVVDNIDSDTTVVGVPARPL